MILTPPAATCGDYPGPVPDEEGRGVLVNPETLMVMRRRQQSKRERLRDGPIG
jgi:hypothetical protein